MAVDVIRTIEQEQLRTDRPEFGPGDTVRVHVKVVEGNMRDSGVRRRSDQKKWRRLREMFTVRGFPRVGVERHSPPLASC